MEHWLKLRVIGDSFHHTVKNVARKLCCWPLTTLWFCQSQWMSTICWWNGSIAVNFAPALSFQWRRVLLFRFVPHPAIQSGHFSHPASIAVQHLAAIWMFHWIFPFRFMVEAVMQLQKDDLMWSAAIFPLRFQLSVCTVWRVAKIQRGKCFSLRV